MQHLEVSCAVRRFF